MATKRTEELRREIAAGLSDLDSGKSQPLTRKTLEAIKAKGKAKLAALKTAPEIKFSKEKAPKR